MHHSFDIKYAEKYGVYEAIMINNFQYWIIKNKANGKHNYDGRTWTYNSVKALEEIFPYWKSGQIRRCIDSLVEQGVLIKGDYNKNRYERPTWYAFFDESLFLNPKHDLPKTENRTTEIGNSITDINTDINTNTIIPPLSPKREKENSEINNDLIDKRGLDEAIDLWLEYKKEKKQKYKGPKSTQAMINTLWKMSSGSPNRAMDIVEFSMGSNYTGFVDPIQRKLNFTSNGQQPSIIPVKQKVEYYDTRWPDRIYICTEEQLEQIRECYPDQTYVVKRKFSA